MGIFDRHRAPKPDRPVFYQAHWWGGVVALPQPEASRTSSIYYDPKTLHRLGDDALQGSQLGLILEQFPVAPDDNPQELF